LVRSHTAPEVEWPWLALVGGSLDADLITGFVQCGRGPGGDVHDGGSGGRCGSDHLDVHAITSEGSGSDGGCKGTLAWTNESPTHIGVGSSGGIDALVAISTVGPGLALVHNLLQWCGANSETHLTSSDVASGGRVVVAGASTNNIRWIVGWAGSGCNGSSASTNIGPSQTTTGGIEGAELATETRVGPCLALVDKLDKWGSGDCDTHLLILAVGSHASDSPSSGASTHNCCRRT